MRQEEYEDEIRDLEERYEMLVDRLREACVGMGSTLERLEAYRDEIEKLVSSFGSLESEVNEFVDLSVELLEDEEWAEPLIGALENFVIAPPSLDLPTFSKGRDGVSCSVERPDFASLYVPES